MRRMIPARLRASAAITGLKASIVAVAAVVLLVPSIASAQQTLNFSVGGFVPKGDDGRDVDDVLVNNQDFLAFDIDDFHGATFGAEWLANMGDKFEAGLGIGYYSNSVPAVWEATHPGWSLARLHGRNRDTWNIQGATSASDRFNYDYGEAELAEMVPALRRLAARTQHTHVIFNNNMEDQGQRNARALIALLN